MQETAQIKDSTVFRVRGTEDGVHRSDDGAAGPKKRQRLEKKRILGTRWNLFVAGIDD